MTSPSDLSESNDIQQLLAEIRRTLSDNVLFLRKLKDDDTDLDSEEAPSLNTDRSEDFEEL